MTFTSSSKLLSKTIYSRPVLGFFSESAHGESGYANKSTRVPMTFSFKSPCLSVIQHRLSKWGYGLESCNKDVPEMTSRPVTISPVPALKLRLVGGTGCSQGHTGSRVVWGQETRRLAARLHPQTQAPPPSQVSLGFWQL